MNKKNTFIKINCSNCGEKFKKNQEYIERRIKQGNNRFYCKQSCANKAHSERMKHEGNPNYGGNFHGTNPSEYSEEKRKEIGRKVSETMFREGTTKGVNNGRWSGGLKPHECVICGREKLYRPYQHQKILSGELNACCSHECSSSFARKSQKWVRTSIEIEMAEELERRGVHYIEQYNLGDKFILDFFLPDHNAVIECDGNYWHTREDVVKRDERKNAYINACELNLFRFWESEINTDVKACVDDVLTEATDKVCI